MIYNKATFKNVFQYQMAKLNAKSQLLLHQPNMSHLSIHFLNVHWKKKKKKTKNRLLPQQKGGLYKSW